MKIFAMIVMLVLARFNFYLSHELEDSKSTSDFRTMYDRFQPECKNSSILLREDSFGEIPARNLSWSLHSGLLQHFLDVPWLGTLTSDTSRNNSFSARCKSHREIVDVVRNYDRNSGSPLPCRLSWFTKIDVCSLLSRYSFVWLNGDSLTRHVRQAFHMILKEDLKYGGFPSSVTGKILEQCVCDGLFSENKLCRSWYRQVPGTPLISDFNVIDNKHGDNVCRQLGNNSLVGNISFRWSYESKHLAAINHTCTDIRMRPVFIYLQAGAHLHVDAGKAIQEVFSPILKRLHSKFQGCIDYITIVCSGATVCSHEVERRYPYQERHLAEHFNHALADWLKAHYPTVLFLNFWNISKKSSDSGLTSDGFHLLSDANLLFALVLMNIMNISVSML
jgi:hypothetical protein